MSTNSLPAMVVAAAAWGMADSGLIADDVLLKLTGKTTPEVWLGQLRESSQDAVWHNHAR